MFVWNSTVINGNRITAGSITASNLAANTITANEIASSTITATQIAASTITAAKMNVSTLSAIAADLGTITAGTVTGATLQTATTGRRVKITSDQYVRWYNGDSVEGYIYTDSSGNLKIDADNLIYLEAAGDGDDIWLNAGDTVYFSAEDIFASLSNNFLVECDSPAFFFNDDNDGADCFWYSNDDSKMKLSSGGNLSIDGSYSDGGADFAEMFESVDGKKIPQGTAVVLSGEKIRPADIGESPIGVISSKPTIIGNEPIEWSEKYLKDDFGNVIEEDVEYWSMFINEQFEKETGQKGTRRKRIKGYSDIEKAPRGADKRIVKRAKLNPEYDATKEYTPRTKRESWNVVGIIGRVRILKNQPKNSNWIKLKDISDTVEEWLIK
jgi:hypothetical protein